MTTKNLDSETRLKLLEIAAQITVASVGNNCASVFNDINKIFEACHESVLKRFSAELEQENS